MEAIKLAGLEPKAVLGYFEKLCTIPHGSGNTKMISDYLVSYAKEHGLRYIQDELNNVILFGDGTCGMEDHAPVILQGHMDMVCDKDPDCTLDMTTEGLDLTHDGEYIFARGTTLGGDDGIAVAYALALLEDKSIPHPPLEVIITVDEEIGMPGAKAIDVSMLKGRTMINIDSEVEGAFTVACAGAATATLRMDAPRTAPGGETVCLTVDGLQGGHSGGEIHKNRGNANKIMGQLLARIQAVAPVRLVSLAGGVADNVIPRSCQAAVIVENADLQAISGIAQTLQAEVRAAHDEPNATVSCRKGAYAADSVAPDATDRIIRMICQTPDAIQAMSKDIPGLPETSLNMGIMVLEEDFHTDHSVRSSVNADKDVLLQKLRDMTEALGGTYSQRGEYPAWEYRAESPLRDTMVRVFREQYGYDPEVMAVHVGLECGMLGEKLPGLDCVSIGPELNDIHTSREKLGIASNLRTWNFLLAVLKAL